MSMVAYKATMFLIFFNYSMLIANYIGTLVFPGDTSSQVATKNIPILSSVSAFSGDSVVNALTFLLLTAGVLALFAFSLLVPTIPFIFMFFGLSTIITEAYIWQLPLPTVFLLPLSMGVIIVYFLGISQYAARSSFSGS